jgi:hypothetical protein
MPSIVPSNTDLAKRKKAGSNSPRSDSDPHRNARLPLAAKPTSRIIEETADQWTFLVKNLQMKLPF